MNSIYRLHLLKKSISLLLLCLSLLSTACISKSIVINHDLKPVVLPGRFITQETWNVGKSVSKFTEYSAILDLASNVREEFKKDTEIDFLRNGLVSKEIRTFSNETTSVTEIVFNGDYPVKSKSIGAYNELTETFFHYNDQGKLISESPGKNNTRKDVSVEYHYLKGYVIARRNNISRVYKLNKKGKICEVYFINTPVNSLHEIKINPPKCKNFACFTPNYMVKKNGKECNGKIVNTVTFEYNEKGHKAAQTSFSGSPLSETQRTIYYNYEYDLFGNWLERTAETQVKLSSWKTSCRSVAKRELEYFKAINPTDEKLMSQLPGAKATKSHPESD